MEFSIKAGNPEKMKGDCVAIAVFAAGKSSAASLSAAGQGLDRATGGSVSRILKHGDFEPKPGATLMLEANYWTNRFRKEGNTAQTQRFERRLNELIEQLEVDDADTGTSTAP